MRAVICLVLVGSVSGCGRAAAEPALFTGHVEQAHTDAAHVGLEPSVPEGYWVLGDVADRCRADEGVSGFRNESLADVDCSDALLVDALRERAAAVGGDILAGLRCTAEPESHDDMLGSKLHACSALVAVRDGAPHVPASSSAPRATAYPSADEAFRVRVTFVPAPEGFERRKPIAPSAVAERAYPLVGRVAMGDVTAKCGGDCSRDVVRHAVRAAAGRVGATDVAGIACVRREHGFLCTGRAMRPEIDDYAVR